MQKNVKRNETVKTIGPYQSAIVKQVKLLENSQNSRKNFAEKPLEKTA
jgi:hypothetical protein